MYGIYIHLQEIVEADGRLIRHGVNKKTMEPNTSHFALIHSLYIRWLHVILEENVEFLFLLHHPLPDN